MNTAIILGGGLGSRLSAIAAPYTKTLLPVNGLPVIAYASMAVAPFVEEIIVVAHPSNAADVHQAVILGLPDGTIDVKLAIQPKPMGMADAIRVGLENIQNDSPVVVMCGDNILIDNINVKTVLSRVSSKENGFPASKLAWTYKILEPEEARRFSVYRALSSTRGILVEKPQIPPSKMCWCGPVAFFSASDARQRAKELNPSKRGEYEATDLMNSYLNKGEGCHNKLIGEWFDVGTPESLAVARNSIESLSY